MLPAVTTVDPTVYLTDEGVTAPRPADRDALVDALVDMLTSPDPEVRDDIAYPILATWIGRGDLDGGLGALGDRMRDAHRHPEIQARTFATMILAWIVRRDALTDELDDATVTGWCDDFATWWSGETDLRGYDDDLGWLHAIAHGADTVRAFARSPRLSPDQLDGLLTLTATRLLTPTDYVFAHNEADRLAYALASVLCRDELADPVGWLTPVYDAIESGEPGPVPPHASNTLATLSALYVTLDRGVQWYHPATREVSEITVPAARDAILDAIAGVLRLPNYYLG
jgi:hypothetical protein